MTEYSKEMVTCMGTLSHLSPMELVDLAEAIEKERKVRDNKKCREKIIAAKNALFELSDYYYHLEIQTSITDTVDVYLTDISEALEQLLYDLN